MQKTIIYFALIIFLTACSPTGVSIISFTPQVWEGDENGVMVTRAGYNVTSSDTERVAQEHCIKFGKTARLIELANPLKLPVSDKFACE